MPYYAIVPCLISRQNTCPYISCILSDIRRYPQPGAPGKAPGAPKAGGRKAPAPGAGKPPAVSPSRLVAASCGLVGCCWGDALLLIMMFDLYIYIYT